MNNGPVETGRRPTRTRSALFQTFVALQQEGFTESQALVIIGQILAANSSGGQA